ncbi:MAG TPA: penicillin-binding transpeptidase domain-containing protein [Thermoanaerobaculia bacterium]|jgi:cell division protein FtsI (penicillin-binding protein 3)|nr:penicillin-binding transpeptidase domain-containing protein [Thermoanaerobaculia bacterium]
MAISQRRLLQLSAFLAAWALVVVFRLMQVQLVRHDHYVARATKQQESTLSLNPVRGSILDARGRVLAESIDAESIYADPQVIENRRATAKALARVRGIGLTSREIESKLRGDGSFAWIARQLPLEVTAEARKLKLPGIYFLEAHRRSYPRAMLAANVIGYVGLDGDGLGGIEHSFDKHVRGTPGKVTLLRDARRGVYLVGGDGANRPRDGHHVVLTIDSVIQFIAERALQKAVTQYRATGGSVLVMDPNDGSILAMASAPSFDPNHFRDYSNIAWRNRNIQDNYEPGSTFKIVTAAAALEEHLVTPSQVIDCGNGSITIANITISEHDSHQYGLLSFEDVIVHSSNVGTVRVGLSLGQQRFYDWIRRFGFGSRVGLPLPGEESGLLRRTDKWTQVSPASISIGQEIGVTPLQITRAVASVATGGMLIEPRIVKRIIDEEGNTVYEPPHTAPTRVMSEKTAAVLNEILKNVVSRGTGEKAAIAEHVVAGKTGTAQKAGRGGYSADRYVGSFAGYVPADQPRLVILAIIDEPRGEHYGGTVAAPVFREVAEGTLRYLGVAPSIPSRTIGVAPLLLATFSQPKPPAGPATAVPDLRGLDARAAIAKAVASGLTVRAIGSGVVTSQNPEPGGALPENRRLTLQLKAEVRG